MLAYIDWYGYGENSNTIYVNCSHIGGFPSTVFPRTKTFIEMLSDWSSDNQRGASQLEWQQMFTASQWHFQHVSSVINCYTFCFSALYLWTTVSFYYKAVNYHLFESSDVLTHSLWLARNCSVAQCSNMAIILHFSHL